MNIQRIFNDDRLMKAVLGMGKAEFQALLPAFTESWYVELKLSRPERIRKIGGGKKGALKTMDDKLFAVLLYLKGLLPNAILAAIPKIRLNFPKNYSAYIPYKPHNLFEKFISNFGNFASKAHSATTP